jgi:hypothetical protein
VTLQQLHLAVSALSNCAAEGAVSAALLLALLLQRADPEVRAAFMGGPGGTALLAAAQYWGYSPGLNLATGTLPFTLLVPVELSKQSAARQLLAVLRRDSKGKAPDWALAGPLDSLGLLLAWCYLVPAGGWSAGLPPEWGPVPHQLHLVMTVHHFLSLERQEFCTPGGCCCGWPASYPHHPQHPPHPLRTAAPMTDTAHVGIVLLVVPAEFHLGMWSNVRPAPNSCSTPGIVGALC